MSTIFTKIINNEFPSYKVLEDENFIAFLDINPLQKGHTLVVPKSEIDFIFDIDDILLAELMIFSKKVAHKLKKSFQCKRIGIAVIGLEVPHAHIHLIPINKMDDMNFSNPKLNLSEIELKEILSIIQNN